MGAVFMGHYYRKRKSLIARIMTLWLFGLFFDSGEKRQIL